MLPATVRFFAELTWKEVDALPRERLLGVVPIGAVEAHGPHLPLATDGIIADAMALDGATRLASFGWVPVVLPGIDYVAAPFAAAFPGTLSLEPETVTRVIVDLARAWGRLGGRALVLANAHLDPAHLASLEAAVREAATAGLPPLIFPNVARRPWALRLTEEFRSGACHAGCYETSIVLAARGELVHRELAAELPENPRSLATAIREGLKDFHAAGGPEAYFGAPAVASADEGRRSITTLGTILAEAVAAELGDPR